MGFKNLIDNLENELKVIYVGGAIRFIDQQYDHAWSKAIDRFDNALSKAFETKNFGLAELERDIFKTSVLKFIELYKIGKNQNKVEKFFLELKK